MIQGISKDCTSFRYMNCCNELFDRRFNEKLREAVRSNVINHPREVQMRGDDVIQMLAPDWLSLASGALKKMITLFEQ